MVLWGMHFEKLAETSASAIHQNQMDAKNNNVKSTKGDKKFLGSCNFRDLLDCK